MLAKLKETEARLAREKELAKQVEAVGNNLMRKLGAPPLIEGSLNGLNEGELNGLLAKFRSDLDAFSRGEVVGLAERMMQEMRAGVLGESGAATQNPPHAGVSEEVSEPKKRN